MEKEPQPDSLTDVTVKQYASSEVYSSEPPPAYHRPQSTAVQVARICALTVVAVSIVLGSFILAAAYVQANASCQEWQQEMQLLQEEQKLQQHYNQAPLQPEALTQEEPLNRQHHSDSRAENSNVDKNIDDNNISQESSEADDDSSEEDEDRTPIHIKLPLQLDFDELAGALIEKNQRSKMNCIVEKKKAEEVIDHQPKSIRLPFGLNLTTDPRYEHVTGERMAIFCESGDDQKPVREEETMMVQPIIVPLPSPMGNPIQFHGGNLQHQAPPQMRPLHQPQMPPQFETIRAHTIIMEPMPQRPPVPVQHNVPPQQNNQIPSLMNAHPLMQHIAQQIVAQHEMAAAAARQQQQQQHNQQQQPQPSHEIPQHLLHQIPHPKVAFPVPDNRIHQIPDNRIPEMIAQRLQHMPEEILTQINRLPNQDQVISVSVTEQEAEEMPDDEVRIVQHPRESAQEMNGRQSYARAMPVQIPVHMMQPEQQPQEQQTRPHYVQPRSVRSVDGVLHHREKRVKRCSCDCAC